MRIIRLLMLFAVAAAPAVARAQDTPAPPLPSVALPAELDRVLRDYERAWAAGDEAALAALFADDGFVLANGRPPVRGRDAIRQAYAGAGGPLSLAALGYAADDSVGYIVGTFAQAAESAPIGKFVLALRRAPGGPWQIAADIDNMSMMPRRPPPPAGAPED
jgi:ketosteroid isomerase-like protein